MGIAVYGNTDFCGLVATDPHSHYEPEWFLEIVP